MFAQQRGKGTLLITWKFFWKLLLQKNLKNDFLKNIKFAVFGLGDSSYPKFCLVGKKLYRRLLQLGGDSIIERGDADDQSNNG